MLSGLLFAVVKADIAQDVDHLLPELNVHRAVRILVEKTHVLVERQKLVNHELLVMTVSSCSAEH